MTVKDLMTQFVAGKLDFDALAAKLAVQKWAKPVVVSQAEKLKRSWGEEDEYEPPDPDSFIYVDAAWSARQLSDEQYAQLRGDKPQGTKPEDKPQTKTT